VQYQAPFDLDALSTIFMSRTLVRIILIHKYVVLQTTTFVQGFTQCLGSYIVILTDLLIRIVVNYKACAGGIR
jgi:hypothetical protein